MQAGELTIATPNVIQAAPSSVTGKIVDLVSRAFGCWHTEMSRPFSRQGQAYRSCVRCGAQRQFNLRNWQMQGDFYFKNPATKQFDVLNNLAAVRRVKN